MEATFVHIAWRNLWRNRRRSLILLGAVTVSIAGLAFSIGVMNAYKIELEGNTIDYVVGHLQVHAHGYFENPAPKRTFEWDEAYAHALAGMDELTGFSKRVRTFGMANNPRYSTGVEILGVDGAREHSVSLIPSSMVEGAFIQAGDQNQIVIGQALADKFQTKLGRKVVLMFSDVNGEVAANAFRVKGIFRGPHSEFERGYVYIALEDAQRLLAIDNRVSDVVCRIKRGLSTEAVANSLRQQFPGPTFEVMTWQEMEPVLVQMMALFSQSNFILYFIIFVAMAFVIANSFLMAVMERIKEFGLLKAMGVRPKRLVGEVLLESLYLAAIGNIAGLVIGGLTTYYFDVRGLDLSVFGQGADYFGISSVVHPHLGLVDYLTCGVSGLVVCLLVTLYPALKGARIPIIKALNYN